MFGTIEDDPSISKNVTKYLKFVRRQHNWFNFDHLPKTLPWRLYKVYTLSKPLVYFFWIAVMTNSLRHKEAYGLFDASLPYLMATIQLFVYASWWIYSQNEHENLLKTFNYMFTSYNEPHMASFRAKMTTRVWEYSSKAENALHIIATIFAIGPLIFDSLLHYAFDVLEKPLVLPQLFESVGDTESWSIAYYMMNVGGFWFIFEASGGTQTQFGGYTLFISFYVIELRLYKKFLKMIRQTKPKRNSKHFLGRAIKWHSELTVLNNKLKAFFGFPCAFLNLFTSLTVTLNLFVSLQSPNFTASLACGFGIFFYALMALAFTSVGQILENESEELYQYLYELPWYTYPPKYRKEIIMMIGHARKPLVIDFHGRWQMNLQNFMDMMSSSYSFFTMLSSTVEE